jgi:hypothetical protein
MSIAPADSGTSQNMASGRDAQPWHERYATGAWLSPSLIMFAALCAIAASMAAIVFLFATSHGTVDYSGRPLGTDFSSFWSAGRMALEGHAAQAYDWSIHRDFQRVTHGVDAFYPWSYPPVFLLVAAAFATLPYGLALLAWQLAGMAAAARVFWEILPGRRALLIGAAFPGVFVCVGNGQTGFLTATLLAGGLLLLPRRQVLAGVLFGLLAYKPQFGLLLPLVLVAGGYWRAIAAAACTVIACVALTTALWGWPVWQAFLDSLPLTRSVVLDGGAAGFEKFQSAFAWVRLLGGSLLAAYSAQALVTAGVLAGCLWIWWTGMSYRLKCAALLTGALLSSPYVLDYDFISFGMAIAFLVAHGLEHGFLRWEKTLLAFAWFVPIMTRSFTKLTTVPIGFLALAAVFALVIVRAVAEQRGNAGEGSSATPPERMVSV